MGERVYTYEQRIDNGNAIYVYEFTVHEIVRLKDIIPKHTNYKPHSKTLEMVAKAPLNLFPTFRKTVQQVMEK
jgi:hypothetical protein